MFKILRWILFYGVLCGLFWTYQHLFFFQPKALDVNHVFTFPSHTKFTSSKIPFDTATVIDVVKFAPQGPVAKGVLLFFHGNRFNVEHYSKYAAYFTKHGYECWMPDYPGYGRSTGEMSIALLEQISVQLYKMARAKYKPGEIIIYGKSLGTGIAAYLASVRDARSVILETPYASLSSLAASYLFFMPVEQLTRYNIVTSHFFSAITAPVTVIHGSSDEVIPLQNAATLINHMKPSDAFYILPGGRHNDLPEHPLYHHVVDSVMAR